MRIDESLRAGAWAYERDDADGLHVAAMVAEDRLADPDLEVVVIARRGDRLTVRVERGGPAAPDAVLYVERAGTFEIARVEGRAGRTLLVLKAWP